MGSNLGLIATPSSNFGMTLTYEVMGEILIIAMETWMTEKKPKTVNLLALNKNQS